MARARNIKPSFFMNEELGALDPLARLLFIGMWTICDFNGCLEYRPARIKAQILPYDSCDTETLMINLEQSGFIRFYSVQGKRYIKIDKFSEHQNPHKNERDAGTDIPNITQADDSINITINREQDGSTPADSLFPLPSSLIPESPIPIPETTISGEIVESANSANLASTSKQKPITATDLVQSLEGLSVSVATDYLQFRKQKKAPLTMTAWKSICKEVMKTTATPDEAISEALNAGWTGFKAQWYENRMATNASNTQKSAGTVINGKTGLPESSGWVPPELRNANGVKS